MTTQPPSSSTPINRRADFVQLLVGQSTDLKEHPTADMLQTYVDAQLAGLPYQTEYPTIAQHLDACVACAEAYGHLYELALAEQEQRLLVPEALPTPDLAFLQSVQQPTWLDQIRAAVTLVGQQLTLQLTPELLPGLQPGLAGGALRAPDDEARFREQLIDLDDEALPLTLAAYRDAQQPTHCILEVTIAPPDRTWPDLADIAVTITVSDETRMARTDAWGLAVFTNVLVEQLAHLQVHADLG